MGKYKKKAVVIEAVQWTGDNLSEILEFTNHLGIQVQDNELYIETLEGRMHASENDWIIKGVHGEFYPCKPDIFEETYEEAE